MSSVTPPALSTPGLARRMAAFAYEGVLLFGVLMAAGLAYGMLTQQRHALQGTLGLQLFVFCVLGIYFIGFWARRGQTLAMRTWHLRLVTRDGGPLSWQRATGRYLLAWLWFVPALALLRAFGPTGAAQALAAITAGVLVYAALARLHPDRQFLHDALCGTRLVSWRPPAPRPDGAAA